MGKRELTLGSKILLTTVGTLDAISPFLSAQSFRKYGLYGRNYNTYQRTVHRLVERGLIKWVDKEGERLIKLTKKGELQILASKLRIPAKITKWDGYWRVIIFDIPESTKIYRNLLRRLLKKQGYTMLQASVWINPYPLPREAVEYLRETKLIEFIRILKVAEMDNDKALRKIFNV